MLLLLFTPSTFASLKLPNGLDSEKRKSMMKTIGFVGTTKYVSNGYMLGGFDGFEISSQLESVAFSSVNSLSATAIDQQNQILTRFGVAKGFYHDIEISFQFIPFFLQTEMSGYSGSLKYTFYEDQGMPLTIDVLVHGGGINFGNLLGVQSTGMDFVINYFMKYWSFYGGFGQSRIIGSFIGGNNGLTEDHMTATEDLAQNRVLAGLSYDFQNFQMGLQVERFYEGTAILKIGKRF
tara:strand:- start:86342 stop:87049 length:708 start_codon:yes stop_codon:yes gene_type:complete